MCYFNAAYQDFNSFEMLLCDDFFKKSKRHEVTWNYNKYFLRYACKIMLMI